MLYIENHPTSTTLEKTHMTVILTLVGLIVFIVSLFTVGFKSAARRLATFAITGLILDVLISVSAAVLITFVL